MSLGYCYNCLWRTRTIAPCIIYHQAKELIYYCYNGIQNQTYPNNCSSLPRTFQSPVKCHELSSSKTFPNLLCNFADVTVNGALNLSCMFRRKTYNQEQNDMTKMFNFPEMIIFLIIACSLIFIGISSNLIIITTFFKSRATRDQATNYFALNLAISDIITCSTILPMWLVIIYNFHTIFVFDGWRMEPSSFETLQYAWSSLDLLLQVASLVNLSCVSVDRCLVITKSFWYRTVVSKVHIILAMLIPWIYAGILTTVDKEAKWKNFTAIEYKAINFSFGFLVPCCVIFISYILIVLEAIQGRRRLSAIMSDSMNALSHPRKKEIRLACRLLALFVSFLVCWLPFFCWYFMVARDDAHTILFVHDFRIFYCFKLLTYVNSVVDPFLYVLIRKSFRSAIKRIFCSKRVLPLPRHIRVNERM